MQIQLLCACVLYSMGSREFHDHIWAFVTSISHMGEILDSDWSRQNLLRSDWLLPIVALITTLNFGFEASTVLLSHTAVTTKQPRFPFCRYSCQQHRPKPYRHNHLPQEKKERKRKENKKRLTHKI